MFIMASVTFEKLPTEIIRLICSHLCLHCSCQPHTPDAYFRGTQQNPNEPSWYSLQCHALSALCLQSKHFRAIAQPILYHQFAPGYGDSWRSQRFLWSGRLIPFMRTIALRPDLANLVEMVFIHPKLLEGIEDGEIADAYEQATGVVGPGEDVELPKCINDLVRVFIGQLPFLQRLSLGYDHSFEDSESTLIQGEKISRMRNWPAPPLPIKTLDISVRSPGNYAPYGLREMPIEACVFACMASKLENLNIHMSWGFHLLPVSLALSCLRNVRITHSRLNATEIDLLLRSSPNLDTFLYEAAGPFLETDRSHQLDTHFVPVDVVASLRPSAKTLRCLHLDLRWCYWAAEGGHVENENLPTLQDFTSLEYLFVDSKTLGSYFYAPISGLLPPSIVSLAIAVDKMDPGSITNMAANLVELHKALALGQFANLRTIYCNEQQCLDEHYGLSREFLEAGILFMYSDMPLSDATLRPNDVHPAWTFVNPNISGQSPDPLWRSPGYYPPSHIVREN